MAFRKYIIRNGKEEAWLTNINTHNRDTTYTYLPDAGKAIVYDTLHEARKIAAECRSRVQTLKMTRDGKAYGKDIGHEKKSI